MATLISFEQFQEQVSTVCRRMVAKNLLLEEPGRGDLAAYEFQDNIPGWYGWLHRDGEWEIEFNGGKGKGRSFEEARSACEADCLQLYSELGI